MSGDDVVSLANIGAGIVEITRTAGANGGISFRVAESIAADLRQKILRGGFEEGPLPKQEDLVAQFGVSGPSIREALRILEAEGLITVRRGKFGGAYVHKPNWSSAAFAIGLSLQGQGVTLNDLANSLLALEPMCAVACAERGDRKTTVVPALNENLKRSELVLGHGGDYTATARAFHDVMVDFVENQTTRLLVRSMVAIWSIQEQIWAYTMQESGQYPEEDEQRLVLRSHRKLVEYIEAGDAESVSRHATKHLRATQRLVLERYGDRVVDASSPAAMKAFKSL